MEINGGSKETPLIVIKSFEIGAILSGALHMSESPNFTT